MTFIDSLYAYIRASTSFLYPAYCVNCREPCPYNPGSNHTPEELCEQCAHWMFRNNTSNCQICAHPLRVQTDTTLNDRICRACRKERPLFRQARSLFVYEGSIRTTLHKFKYQKNRPAGKVLQALFRQSINELELPWSAYDYALSVPTHTQRIYRRGYDHVWLLLQSLPLPSSVSKHPDCLEKWKEIPHQMGLDKHHRMSNVHRSIRMHPAFKQTIRNTRILLVDDVLTTGATANACSRVLHEQGALHVDVLTLCRAVL